MGGSYKTNDQKKVSVISSGGKDIQEKTGVCDGVLFAEIPFVVFT